MSVHAAAQGWAMLAPLVPLVMLGGFACDAKSPGFSEPMTFAGREVPAATLNHGRDLYRMHCVSCHGDSGAGDGPAAARLSIPPRDFQTAEFSFATPGQLPSHAALVDAIRRGSPDRGMPTWKGMRDEDLSALGDYIKTFSPRWTAAAGAEA
jgi:mono/diheme cytochrome c family protein